MRQKALLSSLHRIFSHNPGQLAQMAHAQDPVPQRQCPQPGGQEAPSVEPALLRGGAPDLQQYPSVLSKPEVCVRHPNCVINCSGAQGAHIYTLKRNC